MYDDTASGGKTKTIGKPIVKKVYIRWDEPKLRRLTLLLEVGMHTQDIAESFGTSRRAIQAVANRFFANPDASRVREAPHAKMSTAMRDSYVKLTPALQRHLTAEAKVRGVNRDTLACRILSLVIKDKLIDAILDETQGA